MFHKQNVILAKLGNSHIMGHHAKLVPMEATVSEERQNALSALPDTGKCG